MTRWYVASLADGDTHLAEPAPDDHLVTSHCDGRQFRPLAALRGAPFDEAQVCPACRADEHQRASRDDVATAQSPGKRG